MGVHYNPKSRYPTDGKHKKLEEIAENGQQLAISTQRSYSPKGTAYRNDSVDERQKFINSIVDNAREFLGYGLEDRKQLRRELKDTNIPDNLVSGILYHFASQSVPAGYTIIDDPHMGQTIFVEKEVVDYLFKHHDDLDLTTPEGVLAIRDNPNIVFEELFLGMAAVATLDKMFSGRPINLYDKYRDKPERSSHYHEHMAVRSLETGN